MKAPIITGEHIDTVIRLYEELEVLTETESEAIKSAQAGNDEKTAIVKRNNGEEQTVSEKDLWKEVFYIGEGSEGYPILKERYPNVFEQSALHAQKLQEITAYTVTHLGVDPLKMSLSDIIRLIMGVTMFVQQNAGEQPQPMRYG